MKIIMLIALLSSFLFAESRSILKPIYSVEKGGFIASSVSQSMIIHETKNHFIIKTPLISMDSSDYYVLQLHPKIKDLGWLKDKGDIIDYKFGEFAILESKDKEALLDVATHLHEHSGQCGALQKLSSMPLSKKQTLVKPLLSGRDHFVEKTLRPADSKRILTDVDTMVSWGTRFEGSSQGQKAGENLKQLYQNLIPTERTDIELELVTHNGSQQKSLIIRIPGTSDTDAIVILGSHLDSINNSDNNNAPGADDNASGTSTNLEVFRLLMAQNIKPLKTIEIHAYAAEEIGLVGSGEMADDYKRRNMNVVSMLQFDMNGYSKNGQKKIYFVSNGTDRGLTQEVGKLVDTYLTTPWGTQFLLFGSSDHASWNKRGFPAAFPTENPFAFNGDIHTSDDSVDKLNQPEQMAEFARLGVAYLMHFAGYQTQ